MSFSDYKKYTAIGTYWYDFLPEKWKVASLRWIAEIYAGGTPDKTNLDYWEDGEVPWINSGAVNQQLVTKPSALISMGALRNSSAKWIPHGGLVMALAGQGKTKGMVAQLGIATTCNQSMAAIVPQNIVRARFLYWLIKSHYSKIRNMAGGELRDGLNLEMIGSISVPIPSLEEQKIIAAFLDHETAKIDALIAEQQRLIELLKEKRQAVISHAVTKGLNPNAPMKDSGVEWLGEVPAHWDVRKLKNIVSVRGGSTPSKEVAAFWDGAIPWVSPKDMKSDKIFDSIDHVSEQALDEGGLKMVNKGAVLIVVRGMILIHSVPVAINDVDVTINQDMKALFPKGEVSNAYLMLLLKGLKDAVFQFIDSSAHGTRKLEWERFGLMEIPVPPIQEQLAAASQVSQEMEAMSKLAEEANASIHLMHERRSALISAAVTGKIDVRGWQPSESASPKPVLQAAEEAASYG